MRSIEQSAKTVEEAVQAAIKELGIEEQEAEIEILEEPVKGMFGLGGKEARIRVTSRDGHAAVDQQEMLAAGSRLEEILRMMGIEATVEAWQEDGYIHLNANGPDMGIIIGRQGQTLDSLQFIVNLIVNKNRSERLRIIIDAESYRERRKATLSQMAEKLAGKAAASGQDVVLSAMTPFERRVIHTTLQDHEEVETFSEGEEPYRRVVIRPR